MDGTNYPINQNLQIDQGETTPKPEKLNKPYLITNCILSFLIIVLGAIYVAIYVTRNSDVGGDANTSEANNNAGGLTPSAVFKDLTKEEALAFLQVQTDVNGTLPKDYVGEEIPSAIITNGIMIVSDLNLIYSYGTIEDLKEMAHKEYSGSNFLSANSAEEYDDNNVEIKEYDYYAIVTPKRVKGATSCSHGHTNDCDSLLSFKRSYLDYHQEETSPHSFNDVYYINTQNPDIINYLLRVYTFFSQTGFFGGHGNIYSYNFLFRINSHYFIFFFSKSKNRKRCIYNNNW